MIVDCHGHYTTAPEAHRSWRRAMLSGEPYPAYPHISDDEIRETIEPTQLRLMRERGVDLTLLSPQASAMAHHLGDDVANAAWARACNDLVKRVVDLYPDSFVGVAQLPQTSGVGPNSCTLLELDRCITQLGFVGCNMNPDPSGGLWTGPPISDHAWYALYEKMVDLEVPAMVHGSASCNSNMHTTGAHYINSDTTVFMQLVQADLFTDLPELRLIIPHGGGAVPYHWGRYRGLNDMLHSKPLEAHLMNNIFFDTCVYSQPGMELLFKVVSIDNILFASEMLGAVRSIDPHNGQYFDDTKKYIADLSLTSSQLTKVFHENAARAYPRLSKMLASTLTNERPHNC